ncbi:MAG: hypothetical protein ACJ0SL_09120 [Candidatus Rariloculaceae bacterium]
MFNTLGSSTDALRRLIPVASFTVVLAAMTLVISGCSGGGGGSVAPLVTTATSEASCDPTDPATTDECGTVLLSITDAEGDFVSYTVDILRLTLQRSDGSTVEMLPSTTRVDFAQLVDLSEILGAATVAPGDISGGSIQLDYSNAEIFVEAGGDIVQVDVVDADDAALGISNVEIQLPEDDRLVVTRGRVSLLSVDFDLAASHSVDTGVAPILVTAQPYIVAEVEPVDEKETRLRGALISVALDESTYTVAVMPSHHRDGDHGEVVVHTTSETSYEIGDEMLEGQAGLEALSALPERTVIVAFGTLNVTDREFTAQIVHAGRSVGSEDIDAIYGNVVARNGDQLTVRGAIAVRRDRAARFHRTIIVELGTETSVFKIADREQLLDKDAISVGQRIVAFGQFVETDVAPVDADAPDVVHILDATEGRVRMLVTHLHGTVTVVMSGQINMALRGIDRLGIEHFNFAGTGISSELDADPNDYEIATSTLALTNVVTDRALKVLGFVTPFGIAPPDFEGRTVVDHVDIRSALGISWDEDGTTTPFLSMGSGGLVLDLSNPEIGERHHILIGHTRVSLFELASSPMIVPADTRRRLFGISEPGHVELFKSYEDFVDELTLRLNNFDGARSLAAYGAYDEATNTLTASKISVHMLPPEE